MYVPFTIADGWGTKLEINSQQSTIQNIWTEKWLCIKSHVNHGMHSIFSSGGFLGGRVFNPGKEAFIYP